LGRRDSQASRMFCSRSSDNDIEPPVKNHLSCISIRVMLGMSNINQKAHEVSRELTAWAGSWSLTRLATSGIGPILWQVALGLGPPRPAQREGFLSVALTQTVADACRVRRSPNRAAWRFPDWTAVGFRFERDVPGISVRSLALFSAARS
jgi:hypothetical protein